MFEEILKLLVRIGHVTPLLGVILLKGSKTLKKFFVALYSNENKNTEEISKAEKEDRFVRPIGFEPELKVQWATF